MGTEDFPCPKCSQLNIANRTTCKNCGADLRWAVPYNIPKQKVAERRSALTTVIISVIVIIALGVISIWILDRLRSCRGYGTAPLSAARGIGAAIDSSIQAKHSDYLINGDKYTLDDVLASTAFTGGITYNTTPNNTPAIREICSNVAGDKICVNLKGEQFDWTWTPRVGKTPALIVEDSTSAFP